MKVPLHIVQARRQQVATWMQQHGHVSLQDICTQFKISEATARRDLAALAAGNQIVRTYGGALAEYNHRFASFRERMKNSADAKRRIARKARGWIRPNSTIFLDAGTTLYAVAEELQRNPVGPLEVVTNSLPVADVLASVPDARVHLLGGELLPRQSVLFGEAARNALPNYKIDVAFLGVQGVNSAGLWNSQEDVVAFQQQLLRLATCAVFCVDSSKLDKTAPVFLCDWNEVSAFISNASDAKLASFGIPLRKSKPSRF
ncbi:MAG: DeoR/GlpR family DNA-binding transcription regulator [Verrucomicrobiota bacterium]